MNVLDRPLVEAVAQRLRADPGLIEKDWHVTRALEVLAAFDHGGAIPAFGGGTSLSKGWRLIKRFSEDIDFKVAMPARTSRSQVKKARSGYRERVLAGLTSAGFVVGDNVLKRDESSFFSAALFYPALFNTGPGLRPHIRIEMSLNAATLPPIARPLGSLVTLTQNRPPEIAAFLCVDPVETAADKLSALAWRVLARRRGSDNDDPTIVRHVHDLAALKPHVTTSGDFRTLVRKAMADDTGRGGEATASADPATLFAGMLDRLATDPLWAIEYQDYVDAVSFAQPDEQLGFHAALAAVRDLVALIGESA
jgi:hypothetical protein